MAGIRVVELAVVIGAHTEEILLELGHDWDAVVALKQAGAVL